MSNTFSELWGGKHVKLSPREDQILQLICQGNTINQIAKTIHLSPHTVRTHKENLVSKFKARNIVHLGVLAERFKFLSEEVIVDKENEAKTTAAKGIKS